MSVKGYVTHPLPRGGTDLMTHERQRLRHPPATAWWYRPHHTRPSKAPSPTRYRVVVPASSHENVKVHHTRYRVVVPTSCHANVLPVVPASPEPDVNLHASP